MPRIHLAQDEIMIVFARCIQDGNPFRSTPQHNAHSGRIGAHIHGTTAQHLEMFVLNHSVPIEFADLPPDRLSSFLCIHLSISLESFN